MRGLFGAVDLGATGVNVGIFNSGAGLIVGEQFDPIPTPKMSSQTAFMAELQRAVDYLQAGNVRAVGLVAPPVLHYRTTAGKPEQLPYGVHHPEITRRLELPGMSDDGRSYFYASAAVAIPAMADALFDLRSAIEEEVGKPTLAAKDTVGNLFAEDAVGVGKQLGWRRFISVIAGSGFSAGAMRDGEVVMRPRTFVSDHGMDGQPISPSSFRRLGQVVSVQDETTGPMFRQKYGDLTTADDATREAAAREMADKQAIALARLDPDLGSNYVISGTPARLLGDVLPDMYMEALARRGVKKPEVVITPLGANAGLLGAGLVAAKGVALLQQFDHGIA
jgi:hypothetical protein